MRKTDFLILAEFDFNNNFLQQVVIELDYVVYLTSKVNVDMNSGPFLLEATVEIAKTCFEKKGLLKEWKNDFVVVVVGVEQG